MKYDIKCTPGPWRWEINEKYKTINLCGGRPQYDLTVMDFERWGMQGAQPRFRTADNELGIMQPVQHWSVIVPGREHHSSWFKSLDNPDANLIASAPDLLHACIEALEHLDNIGQYNWGGNQVLVKGYLQQAIQKALNLKK